MAGEQWCVWQSWFKAHYKNYDEVPKDFTEWITEHDRLLGELRAQRTNDGEQTFREDETEIRCRLSNGAVVVGKPDLVTAYRAETFIYDVKTGRERLSDRFQVALYMYLLPLGNSRYSGCKPSGCVVYKDKRVPVPASVIDQAFIDRLQSLLGAVTGDTPARRISGQDCRFCRITKADCAERIESSW